MIRIPKPTFLLQSCSAKVKNKKTTLNSAELEAVLACYNLGPWQIEQSLAGGNSYNLALQTGRGKKIFKKYRWSLPSTIQEHSVLRQLMGTDFPTPPLITNKKGLTYTELGDQHYAIYDFVDGYSFTNYFMPARLRQQLMAEAADTLARFHQLMAGFVPEGRKFNGFKPGEARLWRDVAWHLEVVEQYLERAARQTSLNQLDQFLLSIASEIKRDLIEVGQIFEHPDPQLPRLVIHGDYSPKNILFNRNRIAAVLDFGDACLNLRALDVARGLTSFARANGHGVEQSLACAFLRAYQARQPLSRLEVEAIPDLIRWRYLQNMVWPLRQLPQSRPATANQLASMRNKWQAAGWMKLHGDELRTILLASM